MIKRLFWYLFFCTIFTSPIYAARSLPPGTHPKSIEGEAKGTFPELRGSGTVTFINTGGDARLVTVCDTPTEANVTCSGTDITGTFSGGPDGTAVFDSGAGEIRLQLKDGKVFTFSAGKLSMDFVVTDPSIFNAWVEEGGARDSGARVSDLSGQVEIACPPDLEAWDVMKMGRVIYVDCHLKTGEDSKAVISFSDMTTFEMKPESEIVIDTPPEKESKLSLLMGNIWVNVKQMVKDGTMKVHTSQAVAGIKGTTFILNETGTESTLQVVEGTVAFQSKANGKEVMVSTGESITATNAGLSDKKAFDTSLGKKSQQTKKTGRMPEANKTDMKPVYLGIGGGFAILLVVISGYMLQKKKQK